MPKSAKKPAPIKPIAPTPPASLEPVQAVPYQKPKPVIYERLEIIEYSTASEKGPLTPDDWKIILGWETEKEYQARKVRENPGSKPEHYLFGDIGPALEGGGFQPIHCKNINGEKVVCWNNAGNRAFDMDWCEHLVHTILYGQWAGPFTIPGETVNCETVRISRYGEVVSGQHEGTACILAGEWLAKARQHGIDHPDKPKYPVWRSIATPFIETIVCRGCSADPRVLMTVDYVKPRTAADVFYTSQVFRESTPPERRELCKILASAVDTLWNRTDARGYRTHPEIVAFLDRHKKLLKCVEHIFAENNPKADRKISRMRLQPGTCAALMFIQASSGPKTDGDVYRNEEPPTEKHLDWSLWDRAEEFWTLLASGKDFEPVQIALDKLFDSEVDNEDNQGLGGRGPEKLAILAKAWERWRDYRGNGAPFDMSDLEPNGLLCLSYSELDDKGNKLPKEKIKLLDVADFFGIDCPEAVDKKSSSRSGPPDPPPPTREEIERAMEEAQARRRQQAGKK